MIGGSIRWGACVVMGTLLVACSSGDDKPANANAGGTGNGQAGDSSAAGEQSTGATSTQGGSSTDGGTPAGGAGSSNGGTQSDAGSGMGGQPSEVVGDPPTLEGDGISWNWNGKTYTVNKQMHAGWYNSGAVASISGSDTEDSVPPNMFTMHLMPNMTGTFNCSDYVTPLDTSFAMVWQTFDASKNPPNPGFSYDAALPCEFTITRADKGDTAGDVFEGTFKATLHFPGSAAYNLPDRTVVGTMRWTKQ